MKKEYCKKTSHKRFIRGFSLIEVLVAATIISIAMLSLVPLLISSYRVDTETRNRVRAQQAAAQRLDELLGQTNISCDGIARSDFIDAATGNVYAVAPAVPLVMTRTWIIGAPAANSSLCPITVTVSYTDQGGAKVYQAVTQKGS